MFTDFLDSILPALGDIIGKLSGTASCQFSVFETAVTSNGVIPFVNLFTGVAAEFRLPQFVQIITSIPLGVITLTGYVIPDIYLQFKLLPTWVFVLHCLFVYGIFFIMIKGLYKMIKGWF